MRLIWAAKLSCRNRCVSTDLKYAGLDHECRLAVGAKTHFRFDPDSTLFGDTTEQEADLCAGVLVRLPIGLRFRVDLYPVRSGLQAPDKHGSDRQVMQIGSIFGAS